MAQPPLRLFIIDSSYEESASARAVLLPGNRETYASLSIRGEQFFSASTDRNSRRAPSICARYAESTVGASKAMANDNDTLHSMQKTGKSTVNSLTVAGIFSIPGPSFVLAFHILVLRRMRRVHVATRWILWGTHLLRGARGGERTSSHD